MARDVYPVWVDAMGTTDLVEYCTEGVNVCPDFPLVTLRGDNNERKIRFLFNFLRKPPSLHHVDVIATDRPSMQIKYEWPSLSVFVIVNWHKQNVLHSHCVRHVGLKRVWLLPIRSSAS